MSHVIEFALTCCPGCILQLSHGGGMGRILSVTIIEAWANIKIESFNILSFLLNHLLAPNNIRLEIRKENLEAVYFLK